MALHESTPTAAELTLVACLWCLVLTDHSVNPTWIEDFALYYTVSHCVTRIDECNTGDEQRSHQEITT